MCLRLTAGDGQLSTNVEITVVNANAALTNGLQALAIQRTSTTPRPTHRATIGTAP